MSSLFIREPETIDDYVPKFTYEQIKMGYNVEKHVYRHGFGGAWEEDDPEIGRETYTFSITVLGVKIIGKMNDYYGDMLDTIATIANEFTAGSKDYHPEIHEFFHENATELNNSRRYWAARLHRQEIEKKRREAEEILRQVKRAEWVASMYAVQVKAERWLTTEEKNLLLAEFSGGEYKHDY